MKLYLIRHAQSANNAAADNSGEERDRVPDPEITQTGHQQAAKVAEVLAHPSGETQQHPHFSKGEKSLCFGLTHLYSSLMTRSILTAQYIAKACGLSLVAHPDIFERGGIYDHHAHGSMTGLPGPERAYFQERFPTLELPANLDEGGWYNREYETEEPFLQRVQTVVSGIKQRHAHTNDVVGMVVHGDFIDQFVNEIAGLKRHADNYKSMWVANWAFHNTSITRIDFLAGAEVIVYTNRLAHLPESLITW